MSQTQHDELWLRACLPYSRAMRPHKLLPPQALITKHLHVGRFNRPQRSASRFETLTKMFFGSMARSCIGGVVPRSLLTFRRILPYYILVFWAQLQVQRGGKGKWQRYIHVSRTHFIETSTSDKCGMPGVPYEMLETNKTWI